LVFLPQTISEVNGDALRYQAKLRKKGSKKMGEEERPQSDSEILAEAGDAAFERLNPNGVEPEEPETPEKPAEGDEPKPTPAPSDKGGDDKDAWMKGLDERTLADLKDGKLIPKHRFDEVLERTKAYESLGTPDDIQRRMQDLSKKIDETPKGETPEFTPEEKETQEAILKLFPQLKNYGDLQKHVEKLEAQLQESQKSFQERERIEIEKREAEHQSLVTQGREKIKTFARELGLNENDPDTLEELVDDITGRLHRNEKASKQFYLHGELAVLDEVFKSYKSRFFSGVQRRTEAEILKSKTNQNRLPKPPLSGSPSSPKEKSVNDMDWNEVGERAVSRLG
jgi:hypothetical protein